MKAIIMMYVYYDSSGDIKSITPIRDEQFEKQDYQVTTFSIDEVEDFLTSKKNPSDYFIQYRRKNGVDIFKLLPKYILVNYTRSINNYLTEITFQNKEANVIHIRNKIDQKILIIAIDPILKLKEIDGTDEEQQEIINFKATPKITLYFTAKNDPSFLIKTITVEPMTLCKYDIKISYDEDLTNASLFTKKYFSNYSYEITTGKKYL
jgi:hypothetical protein